MLSRRSTVYTPSIFFRNVLTHKINTAGRVYIVFACDNVSAFIRQYVCVVWVSVALWSEKRPATGPFRYVSSRDNGARPLREIQLKIIRA